jgi:hypothetical protein
VGAFAAGVPPKIDASDEDWSSYLADERAGVLLSALLTITGGVFLLAPIALVVERARNAMAVFAFGAWVIAWACICTASITIAAAAWFDSVDLEVVTALVDMHHLATWALSAPAAAIAVVATTAAVRAPRWLEFLAGLKVATCVVEVAGLWSTSGWNAGGRAAFTSAIATVLWFAGLLVVLSRGAVASPTGTSDTGRHPPGTPSRVEPA